MREIRSFRGAQLGRDFERHGVAFVDPDASARDKTGGEDEPGVDRVVA
jgi:hypothetical protein